MHLKKLSKSTNSSVQTSPGQANPAIEGIEKIHIWRNQHTEKIHRHPSNPANAGWIKQHPLRTIDVNLHEYRVSN
jgi:hypothetical protein